MADEQKHIPPDPIAAGAPPILPTSREIAPGLPPEAMPETKVAKGPPPSAPASAVAVGDKKPAPTEIKDGTREIIETVVFVVVLVLLLKTFLAEAFVIPTGSMAPTLLGYHKNVKCEKCGYPILVNASSEVEDRPRDTVIEWQCPNCRYKMHLRLPKQQQQEDGQ
jgi:hypothetical protein